MFSWLPTVRSRTLFFLGRRTCINPNKPFDVTRFLKKPRKYTAVEEELKDPMQEYKEYIPTDNLVAPPNDEWMRMSVPEIDPFKVLKDKGIRYEDFVLPQSYYFAVIRNGTVYHVFDASKLSVGRIATRAAVFLRGKHKPNYDPKKMLENGDRIIVVNGEKMKVTGKKRIHWIFRHHTQYAGGLKEIVFEDLMRKDPQQLVRRVIKGMLPINRTRKFLLERVTVHRGQYHPHIAQKLPQFMNQPLPDPNLMYGLPDFNKPYDEDSLPHESLKARARQLKEYKVVYESNPEAPPQELSHLKREYNESMLKSPQYKRMIGKQQPAGEEKK